MLNVVRIADGIMRANKRIPVSEDTWRELARIKEAGQAYDRLLRELIWGKEEKETGGGCSRVGEGRIC